MLESKKYNLIEWIISVADERVIDALQSIRNSVERSGVTDAPTSLYTASSYSELRSRKVDVNQLKTEQGYASSSTDELSAIAREAHIVQSIDDLLEDLKLMD